MKDKLSLKLIGFTEVDKKRFLAILWLAEGRLLVPVTMIDEAEADYYVLPESLETMMRHDTHLKRLPIAQCIFYTTHNENLNGYRLLADHYRVPSLNSFVTLFNKLALREQENQVLPQIPENINNCSALSSDVFDREQGLLGRLLASLKTTEILALSAQRASLVVFIDAAEKLCYSPMGFQDLLVVLSHAENFTVLPIPNYTLQEILAHEQLDTLPLNKLLWWLSLSMSKGRMPKDYAGGAVRLKTWPDAPYAYEHLIRLAMFMHNNSASLSIIAEKTRVPLDKVYDFYNACRALGWTEEVEQEHIKPLATKLTAEQRSLFSQLNQRLVPVQSTSL